MKKNIYIKPLVQTVELKMRTALLIGSKDAEGMEKQLIIDEDEAVLDPNDVF
jgi:hypothetical protein